MPPNVNASLQWQSLPWKSWDRHTYSSTSAQLLRHAAVFSTVVKSGFSVACLNPWTFFFLKWVISIQEYERVLLHESQALSSWISSKNLRHSFCSIFGSLLFRDVFIMDSVCCEEDPSSPGRCRNPGPRHLHRCYIRLTWSSEATTGKLISSTPPSSQLTTALIGALRVGFVLWIPPSRTLCAWTMFHCAD